jgi:hypothetical protein
MFVDEMRRAIAAAPSAELCRLASAVWKAYGAGAIGESDAQALAEAVHAKQASPAPTPAPRRAGSRPRAPESLERRRRWVASGLMPPQVACQFTMGEGAVLAVIAAEVSKRGRCTLTIGHIAAVAGVCRSTVKNAVRQAGALGLIRSEEWRLSAWRSAPNTVTIISAEWSAWLRLGQRGQGVRSNQKPPRLQSSNLANIELGQTKGRPRAGTAKSGPKACFPDQRSA